MQNDRREFIRECAKDTALVLLGIGGAVGAQKLTDDVPKDRRDLKASVSATMETQADNSSLVTYWIDVTNQGNVAEKNIYSEVLIHNAADAKTPLVASDLGVEAETSDLFGSQIQ